MVEEIQIGEFKPNRTLMDKILGRNKPISIYMRGKPPFFHYEVTSGENIGAFTTVPVTQATDSYLNLIIEERESLISQGKRVV